MTTAPHWFGSLDLVMLAGQVMAVHCGGGQVVEQTKPELILMVSMVQPVALRLQSEAMRKRSLTGWPLAEAGRLAVVVM